MDDETISPELPAVEPPVTAISYLGRGIVWTVVIAVAAFLVAVDPVSTYRGTGLHSSARFWEIWRGLSGALPLPSFALVLLGLLFVIGVGWALWLVLVASGSQTGPIQMHPPKWALGSLLPIALIAVVLGLWAAPRDDVTAEALISETGLEQTMIPTACAGFLGEAASLQSGNVDAGPAERSAAGLCRSEIATAWPTRSAVRATGVAVWSTVEAVGR